VVVNQGLPRLPARLVGQAERGLVGCLLLQLEMVSSDVNTHVQLQAHRWQMAGDGWVAGGAGGAT
jgi:hypothetical protein